MRILISMIFTLLTCTTFASTTDCYQEEDPRDKRDCMIFERDQAIGRLMSKLTRSCEAEAEWMVDECMAKKLDELTGQVEEMSE